MECLSHAHLMRPDYTNTEYFLKSVALWEASLRDGTVSVFVRHDSCMSKTYRYKTNFRQPFTCETYSFGL